MQTDEELQAVKEAVETEVTTLWGDPLQDAAAAAAAGGAPEPEGGGKY